MSRLSVLVTGATGKQGGAVARRLLAAGHHVRALTRKPDSPRARELEKLGTELAQADFLDPGAMARAARGVDAVFAMSTPYELGSAHEYEQGREIALAAKAAGVRHLVYSSVAGAGHRTGIPHFDSKRAVEQRIASLGIPYTVIAPVAFMDNVLGPFAPGLKAGTLAMPLPAKRKLQQIAAQDIGAFAALIIERRDPFLGRRIEIASDELTGEECAGHLGRALGMTVHYQQVPLDVLWAQSEDQARMWQYLDRTGYTVDIAALRRDWPEVGWHKFDEWLREQDLRSLKEAPGTGAWPNP